MSETNRSNAKKIVESAIMVAIGTVLSLYKLIDLPYGGSVTVACMLPVILIAYRYGFKWGMITGLVFAIIQQLLGLDSLSYVTTWQSVVAVMLLDYIVAYMATGLGGIFRKKLPQPGAVLCGSILVCAVRYVCHVISGATVWAGLSIPTNAALIYSIGYNATYMVPETIITAILGFYIASVLDFTKDPVTSYKKSRENKNPVLRWTGSLVFAAALLFDTVMVFSHIQNEETGEFDITGLKTVQWPLLLIVTAIAAVIAVILFMASRRENKGEA